MRVLLALAVAWALWGGSPSPERAEARATTPRSSTIACDAARVIVVNEDSGSISEIDPLTHAKVAEIRVCETPRTVALAGDRAFVPCGDGRIASVDLLSRSVTFGAVGLEPYGAIVDASRLYISDHGNASVHVLDATTLTTLATIPTEAFPRGMALDAARGLLYVTHFRSGRISVIDTQTLNVIRVISTGADSNLSQSIVLAGNRAYLPQTRSDVTNRALLFDNTVFPIVTAIDLTTGSVVTRERISLDIVDQPVNMPIDAALTSGGKLYVIHAGSDDLSAITLPFQETVAHLPLGSNPTGIALSPDQRFAYVNNALSGTVGVIDTATDAIVATTATTAIPMHPDLLRGKILFNSSSQTTLSKDRWISCATCHFEGGTDGRTWFFRDGVRNTPALFGVASTLPLHWSGDLDELQDVESTIRTVQSGTGLASGDVHCTPACDMAPPNASRSGDLDDLALFMTSLRSPRRRTITSDASRRGEALFASQCASCHPAPLYTDRRKHDVGTGTGIVERKGSSFDTPSLRGVFDSAPYLHDGSAPTIRDAITRHTSVTGGEADDLAAFVLSLPYPQQRRRSVR